MIIPLLDVALPPASPTPPESWAATVIDSALPWQLTGKLAFRFAQPVGLDLVPVIRALAGRVDLELELHDEDLSHALAFLNEGADRIVATSPPPAELGIPEERWSRLHEDDDPGAAPDPETRLRIAAPSPEQLAPFLRRGTPVQIPVDALAQPPHQLADFLIAALQSDRPDGLWPTLIVDPLQTALGLAWSNAESLRAAVATRRATYWSRSRDELWEKGKTSGATQHLRGIRIDCDADCLRFEVDQQPPGFCHRETHTCFGEQRNIQAVLQRLQERIEGADEKSFTRKLVQDPAMLEAKLLEEARELAEAETDEEIVWEAADLLYFALVKLASRGLELDSVYAELARRMNRVVRRKNKLEQNPNP